MVQGGLPIGIGGRCNTRLKGGVHLAVSKQRITLRRGWFCGQRRQMLSHARAPLTLRMTVSWRPTQV